MVINVVESVLGDVTNDQVGVLPDLTALVGLHVTNEELDEGRFAGSIGTEDGDTRRERDLESDVVQLLNGLGGVLESNLAHFQQTLLLGLDTLKKRWVGEFELVVLGSLECVIRLGLGDLLDKGLEVAFVSPDLEAVQVEDIGDGVVEEARIVGHNDYRRKMVNIFHRSNNEGHVLEVQWVRLVR